MSQIAANKSLWSLVRDGASRVFPSKTAVWNADRSCTFGELIARAKGIASTLHRAGIGRGDRVGIWMDKTPECVQSILGVLAAGAAYVPLDPRAPWRRCRTIALDCGFAGLVVDDPRLPSLPSFLEGAAPRCLLVDASNEAIAGAGLPKPLAPQNLSDAASAPPADLPDPSPADLAYILYTSGSTGTPKGVIHTHASGLAFTEWIQQRFGIVAEDVFSSHAPFHFDLSISDLYASLGSGARVRLISSVEGMLAAYLVKLITECGITVWYSVPSILVSMLDVGALEKHGLPTVRTLFFAGEVFPTPQLRRLRRAVPHAGLYNLFGPTETNVCTYYEVPPDIPDERTAPIPIGKVCEHMEAFVLDEKGNEVGCGVEGVLWIKGGNLMSGYWNDASRTASTLIPDPRGRQKDGMAYCTGDYVKLMPDGNYEFLGRRDHMIKTRGFRVELGEIESVLTAHPGVLEAVALPLPDPAIGNRIVASIVPCSGEQLESNQLRAHCSRFLPTYMVPEQIEIRPSLARTSTGKADRQALRQEWQTRLEGDHLPS
jgi:amino acid adenylation domain-containing protein